MTKRPLRVCHIAYTFYESDNRVMRYVQTLATRGDRVDVIALRKPEQPWQEFANNAHFYRIQRRQATEQAASSYLFKILWFLIKATVVVTALQCRRRYDVVHVHNVPDFLVFAAWLPKLMGARVILDIHDILPELYAGKFQSGRSSVVFRTLVTIERVCCTFADHVIIGNDLWHARLTERSVPMAKCTAFLNYPDLSVFKPRTLEWAQASPFIILYPGTLNHHQGVDLAVRAFAQVRPEMADAEFHIYGRGPALPELVRLAKDLGVERSVKFMASVGLTEIAPIMAAASLGVVPKRADGFGNEAFSTKIFEFMASGVPVAVSRTRIDSFYFNDDLVNFFAPGDSGDLARVLLQVYREYDAQREKVHAAEAFAGRHSWQVRGVDYKLLVDTLAVGAAYRRRTEVQGTRY
jgi:glycosyltransferase involved in cell wall biosynthesis